MKVSWENQIPNKEKSSKCSKPPTKPDDCDYAWLMITNDYYHTQKHY